MDTFPPQGLQQQQQQQQQQPQGQRQHQLLLPQPAAGGTPAFFDAAMLAELQAQATLRGQAPPPVTTAAGGRSSGGSAGGRTGGTKAASRKSRREGTDRFEYIRDKTERKVSQSKQIKQIKIDLVRLLLTTGAHSILLVVPESWCVHKFATAGDFNSFLEMYACALEAQRKRQRRAVALSIDEVWERFQGKGGLHQIEGLCAALLKEGCNAEVVDEAKDAYLAALVSNDDSAEVSKSLSRHLNGALRNFIHDHSALAE